MKALFFLSMFVLVSVLPCLAGSQDSTLKNAWNYFENGNYKKALKSFENAAHVTPENPEIHIGIGSCCMKMGTSDISIDVGMIERAAQAFEFALRSNPQYQEARYNLGLAYLLLDDRYSAEKQLAELQKDSNPFSGLLATKIAAYKTPEQYVYLQNEHNTKADQLEAMRDAIRRKEEEVINRRLTIERAKQKELAEKKRMIDELRAAREAAAIAENRARAAELAALKAAEKPPHIIIPGIGINTGATNPYTGEYYAPAGQGYVGTRDGTYYAPAGPNGVINTRSGTFIPVH